MVDRMESEWMRDISSNTICNFFYGFFIVYAILFIVAIFSTISSFFFITKLGAQGIASGIQGLLMTGLAATMMMFFYMMCDRALLGGSIKTVSEGFRINQVFNRNRNHNYMRYNK